MLREYLEDLESRIDPRVEEDLLAQWKGLLNGNQNSGIFSPVRYKATEPQVEWPAISVNEALADHDCMVIRQLAGCSTALAGGSGAIMNVRARIAAPAYCLRSSARRYFAWTMRQTHSPRQDPCPAALKRSRRY